MPRTPDEIEDLLRAEGERWRAEVDTAVARVHPAVRAQRSRWVAWTGSLAAAAVVGVLAVQVAREDGTTDAGGGGRAASAAGGGDCAAPGLWVGGTVRPAGTPVTVTAGRSVQVTDVLSGVCDDTGGQRAAAVPRASGSPRTTTTLLLRTADGRTTRLPVTTTTDETDLVVGRVVLPRTAAPGPATLTDDHGHTVRLRIER